MDSELNISRRLKQGDTVRSTFSFPGAGGEHLYAQPPSHSPQNHPSIFTIHVTFSNVSALAPLGSLEEPQNPWWSEGAADEATLWAIIYYTRPTSLPLSFWRMEQECGIYIKSWRATDEYADEIDHGGEAYERNKRGLPG